MNVQSLNQTYFQVILAGKYTFSQHHSTCLNFVGVNSVAEDIDKYSKTCPGVETHKNRMHIFPGTDCHEFLRYYRQMVIFSQIQFVVFVFS